MAYQHPENPPKSDAKSLKELRSIIRREVDYVDIRPYSHNIISLVLRAIASHYGKNKANQAIKDFGLKKRGWAEEK